MNDPIGCGCDPQLRRPILTTLSHLGWEVLACLHCGKTACTEARGDDGRFTGEPNWAYCPVWVPPEVMEWMSQWPRISPTHQALWPMRAEWVPRDGVFFPAHFRCATAADLAVAEADFAAAQQTMTVRESIRTCGFPKGDAPSELPANLIAFGMMARAMQLTADSPLDDLLHHAQLASAASGVAAQLITERADASDFFLETLQSRNIARVGIALAMTREWKQLPSDTTSLILEQLSTMPLTAHREAYERIEGCERFELLLLMLSELRPVAPETPAALRVLMRRVARHDATLVGCIRAVLAVLESPVAAK